MGTELLAVPEERLTETILVIRAGLRNVKVSEETRTGLLRWCDDHMRHLRGIRGEDGEIRRGRL